MGLRYVARARWNQENWYKGIAIMIDVMNHDKNVPTTIGKDIMLNIVY
jgi:hypothetical protein